MPRKQPEQQSTPDPKADSGNVENHVSGNWVRGEEGGEATDRLLSHSRGMTYLLFSQSVYQSQIGGCPGQGLL